MGGPKVALGHTRANRVYAKIAAIVRTELSAVASEAVFLRHGAVQFVPVETYIWVANLIGQRGVKRGSSGPPIRYEALASCLTRVAAKALELGASVHMPRIGCGLAGGDWARVEPLVEERLVAQGIAVTVYDYE